jgi:hypothetical protein
MLLLFARCSMSSTVLCHHLARLLTCIASTNSSWRNWRASGTGFLRARGWLCPRQRHAPFRTQTLVRACPVEGTMDDKLGSCSVTLRS